MFKKLFSYIIPLNIFKQKSAISESLEVTWANGELVLDSKNTNYSYGSLQRILRKGLITIGFENIKSMKAILVLGVGGGSVIKTLVEEINFTGQITGVEIDEAVIEIANTYFDLNKISNLKIVVNDAYKFVLETENKFDLIIIDIFQDTKMPDFLFQTLFINRICFLLKSNGNILFNTMPFNEIQKKANIEYINNFDSTKYKTTRLSNVEDYNELILIKKSNIFNNISLK